MKFYPLLFSLIFFPIACFSETDDVEGDINCDGNKDSARIAQVNDKVVLTVVLHDGTIANELSFGVGDPMRQDALCGMSAHLNSEQMTEDLSVILEQNPEGYRPSSACIGLNISGGECDSIHIFWNHVTNELNWWRI